jgi:hypothetical protein
MIEESEIGRRTRETIRRSIEARQRAELAKKRAGDLAAHSEQLAENLSLAQVRRKQRVRKRDTRPG